MHPPASTKQRNQQQTTMAESNPGNGLARSRLLREFGFSNAHFVLFGGKLFFDEELCACRVLGYPRFTGWLR